LGKLGGILNIYQLTDEELRQIDNLVSEERKGHTVLCIGEPKKAIKFIVKIRRTCGSVDGIP